MVWTCNSGRDNVLLQERIQFPPHPKTLTRAGDYEYFAAQVGWSNVPQVPLIRLFTLHIA